MASLARPLTPGRGAKCVICNTDSSPDLLVSCLGCGVTVHIDEYYTHWEKGEEIPAEWYYPIGHPGHRNVSAGIKLYVKYLRPDFM